MRCSGRESPLNNDGEVHMDTKNGEKKGPAYIEMAMQRELNREFPGKYLEIDGKKIFYREEGKGDILVYIHGNLANSWWWTHVMTMPGFRTIAVDMPNFGRSDRIESSEIASYGEWLKRILDRLGVKTASFVGHSLGGAICQQLALTYPTYIENIILLDSASIAGLPVPEQSYPVFEMYKADYDLLRQSLAAIVPTVKEATVLDRITDIAYLMNRESFAGHARTLNAFNLVDRAAGFDKPMLFIRGKLDILVTREMAEFTSEKLNGKLVELDGVGHSPNFENPELFRKVTGEFLAANR